MTPPAAAAGVMFEDAATRLVDFLGSDDGAEMIWLGALTAIERAVDEARSTDPYLWRSRARALVGRFAHDVGRALDLAELAAEAQAERERDLATDLLDVAREVGGRRDQTVPAEIARRVNAENRRRASMGLPPFEPSPEWQRRAVAAVRAHRPLPFPRRID